jgi:hypothetical protein
MTAGIKGTLGDERYEFEGQRKHALTDFINLLLTKTLKSLIF